MKKPFSRLLTAIAIGANLVFFPAIASAQIYYNHPPTPPDKDAPGNPGPDGGTRNPCTSEETSLSTQEPLLNGLVAIVPATETSSESLISETDVWGQTTATHPTFWFYIPPSATSIEEARLIIEEDESGARSEYRFTLPETAGIIGLTIPSSEAPLAVGEDYYWAVKLYCEFPTSSTSSSPNFLVDGWIERVELDPIVEQQLSTATPYEKAVLYGEEVIWYEMLAELIALRRARSPEVADDWSNLLEQVDFSELAEQPIMDCCSLEKVEN